MRFRIKDIPATGRTLAEPISRALLRDALTDTDGDDEGSHAHIDVELTKADDNVFVRGRLTGALQLPCAGCLRPTDVTLDTRLRFTFVPEGTEAGVSADPLDDVEVSTHDRQVVDLGPMVREQLIMALPIALRCHEGCRGLCPVCGQNRNERECGHAEAAPPSALSAQLEKIRNQFPKG